MIAVGDRLPPASLLRIGPGGPEPVDLAALLAGRRVVVFGLPGAYTPTCASAHMPSFVRNADAIRARGVDEIICIAVNDPHVLRAWGADSGGTASGIALLADAGCELTEALGLRFDAPQAGMIARSQRYAMIVEDGTVTHFNLEQSAARCTASAGEAILAAL